MSEILFRPSSLGKICTSMQGITARQLSRIAELETKQLDKPLTLIQSGELADLVHKRDNKELSTTTKRELIRMYRLIKYKRYNTNTNKYVEKGIKCEEDSITLYSLYKGKMYKKNKERFTNELFSGEPDIIDNDCTIDIKSSWSIDTFPTPLIDSVDRDYVLQGYAYNMLLGKRKHIVAYCLVNAPLNMLIREKEILYYNMNTPDDSDEQYIEGLRRIEMNMIFDVEQFERDYPTYDLESKDLDAMHIPHNERVIEYQIDYSDSEMFGISEHLIRCREWLYKNTDIKKYL